jgi:hypothetical protein
MRSDLVFTAMDRVKNPFLLCHLVRISSRRFHKNGESMQHTINKILDAVTEHDGAAGIAKTRTAAA